MEGGGGGESYIKWLIKIKNVDVKDLSLDIFAIGRPLFFLNFRRGTLRFAIGRILFFLNFRRGTLHLRFFFFFFFFFFFVVFLSDFFFWHFIILFSNLSIFRLRSFVIQERFACLSCFSGMFSNRVSDRELLNSSQRSSTE